MNATNNGTMSPLNALAEKKRLPVSLFESLEWKNAGHGGITMPYFGVDGQQLFVRTRNPEGAERRFNQPKGVKLEPYGLWKLADVVDDPRLFLAEGETDTITLWQAGLPALGIPGAQSSGCIEASHIAGVEEVYLCGDADEAGQKFNKGMVERLHKIGFKGRLYTLELPNGCKDVSDLYVRNPEKFTREMELCIKHAREVESNCPGAGTIEPGVSQLVTTTLADVRMRPVEWLVPDFIPRGYLTVFAGDGGQGKSSVTNDLVACWTTGRPCMGLDYPAPGPMRVLMVGCEDGLAETVVPRLAAAGANLAMVEYVESIRTATGESLPFEMSESGWAALESHLSGGNYCAVVIDPVSAFVPDRVDDHKDAHVRGMLRPGSDLALRYGISVVIVKHLNKSETGNAGNLIAGSRAYVNAARAAFLVGPDPDSDDSNRRVIVFCKYNLTNRTAGLAFSLDTLSYAEQDAVVALPQADGLDSDGRELLKSQLFRVAWRGDSNATKESFAKSRNGRKTDGDERVEDCARWLAEFCQQARPQEEVFKVAKSEGYGRDVVYKAKKKANVRSTPAGFSNGWRWQVATHKEGEVAAF